MNESSPADLAIAFRSFARRLHDALEPVGGDTTVAALQIRELHRIVEQASEVTGSSATVGAVADAIEAKPAGAWSDANLAALRTCALEGGKILRTIQRTAEKAAADRCG